MVKAPYPRSIKTTVGLHAALFVQDRASKRQDVGLQRKHRAPDNQVVWLSPAAQWRASALRVC